MINRRGFIGGLIGLLPLGLIGLSSAKAESRPQTEPTTWKVVGGTFCEHLVKIRKNTNTTKCLACGTEFYEHMDYGMSVTGPPVEEWPIKDLVGFPN